MRMSRDEYFLKMAELASLRGTCFRRQVGCILVNSRNHVVATGMNGVPSGFNHCNDETSTGLIKLYPHACEGAFAKSGTNLDGCQAIHAEENALLQCERVWEIETCYCTASPCFSCLKKLLNTSCRKIVFLEKYPHPKCEELWVNSSLRVEDKIYLRKWVHYPKTW